jgi:hypothetical protein
LEVIIWVQQQTKGSRSIEARGEETGETEEPRRERKRDRKERTRERERERNRSDRRTQKREKERQKRENERERERERNRSDRRTQKREKERQKRENEREREKERERERNRSDRRTQKREKERQKREKEREIPFSPVLADSSWLWRAALLTLFVTSVEDAKGNMLHFWSTEFKTKTHKGPSIRVRICVQIAVRFRSQFVHEPNMDPILYLTPITMFCLHIS